MQLYRIQVDFILVQQEQKRVTQRDTSLSFLNHIQMHVKKGSGKTQNICNGEPHSQLTEDITQ